MRKLEENINSNWVAKYPFDPASKQYLKTVSLDINEYFSEDLIHVIDYSFTRALSIRYGPKYEWENDDLEAISYFIASLIIRGTENRYIYYMYADTESKRAYKLLLREEEDKIANLANHLGIPLNINYELGKYGIPITYYLKVASRFLSPHWKMYYNQVLRGYVYIEKRQIARIISELAKDYIIDDIEKITVIPSKIKQYSKKLLAELSGVLRRIEKSTDIMDYIRTKESKYYPPCIKWMIRNIGSGLPHMARFTLVTFLLKMGYTIDEIVSLFSRTPDYNPERTRYQVEHISGLRGGRKVYAVPSCRTLKSYGLCFPDQICIRIKHPLQYISRIKRIERAR